MSIMLWRLGSIQGFAELSRKSFPDATVLPNADVFNEANRLSLSDPRSSHPREVPIELQASNDHWSVYCIDEWTTLAVSTTDNQTVDLDDLDEKEHESLCLP